MALIQWVAAAAFAAAIITRDDVPDAEYHALGGRPEFASVARILVDSGGSASGVLIAPRWVITAAHVASAQPPTRMHVDMGGERIAVRRVVVHPEYLSHAGLQRPPFDQALLELERASSVRPSPLASVLPSAGTLATIVGYGVGGPGAREAAGTRRAAHNRVDQLGGRWRGREWAPHLLLLDFDVPGRESRNALGSGVAEPLEGIASGGDSGGGLFVHRDGAWELAGTFSLSSVEVAAAASRSFAGTVNIFVGVAAHRDWIDRLISTSPLTPQR